MTQAQKNNAVKFKKAIAIRKKTGCSLKEAFAEVYGKKKVGAVKKKVVKKSAPKKKVAKKKAVTKTLKYRGTLKSEGGKKIYKYSLGATKKPTEKAVLKSIKKAESVQKKHMAGISMTDAIKHSYNEMLKREKKYLEVEKHILQERIELEHLKIQFRNSENSQAKKVILDRMDKAKKYLFELKTHAKELKKHI
jgi:hypothetical protein